MTTPENLCYSQNTLSEVDSYVFSHIFNSKSQLKEFIELNEKGDTTRYWQFDETGKLKKEISNSTRTFSLSIGGFGTESTATNREEFQYFYLSNGQIKNIEETKYTDGEILKIIHEFKYPNQDTIIEYYEVVLKERFEVNFLNKEIRDESRIQEKYSMMTNSILDNYLETINRIKFKYNKQEQLKQKDNYFSINSYSKNEEPELMVDLLSSTAQYTYDEYQRIARINEVEFTEEGTQKLSSDIRFKYKGKSKKIKRVNIIYGENYSPNKLEYKIKYKLNGDIKRIEINEKCYKYIRK